MGFCLLYTSKPPLVDGLPSPDLADFIDRHASRIRRYAALDGKAIAESFADDRIRFCNVTGNDLYHQRRSYEDGELLFLVNSSLSDTATGSVGLPAGELVELDAVSGDMRPYPHTADGKSVGADFSLPPAGSLLLFEMCIRDSFRAVRRTGASRCSALLRSILFSWFVIRYFVMTISKSSSRP